jgi:hypothetical protein
MACCMGLRAFCSAGNVDCVQWGLWCLLSEVADGRSCCSLDCLAAAAGGCGQQAGTPAATRPRPPAATPLGAQVCFSRTAARTQGLLSSLAGGMARGAAAMVDHARQDTTHSMPHRRGASILPLHARGWPPGRMEPELLRPRCRRHFGAIDAPDVPRAIRAPHAFPPAPRTRRHPGSNDGGLIVQWRKLHGGGARTCPAPGCPATHLVAGSVPGLIDRQTAAVGSCLWAF